MAKDTAHTDTCEWHHDQYWFECTCHVYAARIADVGKAVVAYLRGQAELHEGPYFLALAKTIERKFHIEGGV